MEYKWIAAEFSGEIRISALQRMKYLLEAEEQNITFFACSADS